jgi:hypothetical protein
MKHDFFDLGPASDFPAGAPVLRKGPGGLRFACVREGEAVHAVDDRCPHQGYPLSQGEVRGGVLTCRWHNWKFELASGACAFGGEPVRRYATRIEDGRVRLDLALDRGAEVRRLVASLKTAQSRDETARALRDGLRLGDLGLPRGDEERVGLGKLATAFEVVAIDGAERARDGFDHGLAVLEDLCAWADRGLIKAEEAFVLGAHAIAAASVNLGVRGAPTPGARVSPATSFARLADLEGKELEPVKDALVAERREEAESLVRAIVESRGIDAATDALLPFVARHLYDGGHGAIFVAKALELSRRFPLAAIEVFAAVTVTLAWATADTALPPFSATHSALEQTADLPLGAGPLVDRAAYEIAVLAGESEAVTATVALLASGTDPAALLRAVGRAAAERLLRFDAAWESRTDADVTVLRVSHAVTFAEAAIALTSARPERARIAARLAVQAAGFVGKLRRGDAPSAQAAPLAGVGQQSLLEAASARDVAQALAIVTGLGRDERSASYDALAPFAAFDAATLPIFYAHAIKVSEALRRLDAADDAADDTYLRALVAYLVPVRRERHWRRTAAIAVQFLSDGRPTKGLY